MTFFQEVLCSFLDVICQNLEPPNTAAEQLYALAGLWDTEGAERAMEVLICGTGIADQTGKIHTACLL